MTKEELAKLISGFENMDLLTSNGVTLAGQRYIYLSGTDRVVRAKYGRSGVHCMKTTQGNIQCFIIKQIILNVPTTNISGEFENEQRDEVERT